MRLRNLLALVLGGVVAVILYYSFSGKDSSMSYLTEINDERRAKNEFMRSSDESPFGSEKKNFKTLDYFPVDPKYRISAKLVPIGNKKIRVLPTSDGLEKRYLEYGNAEFELEGTNCKLLILEIMEDGPYRGTLFLAFADKTSANETYGAGRYLDVKKVPGASSVTLDFNQSYNPYCAYSENYSCPFPPKENMLTLPVQAGEKKYHD
jgi:uncharacterized protein (DUF1684 family)